MAVLYEFTNTISSTEFSLTNNSTSLAARTDVGPIFIFIDANAMIATDEFLLTIYEKAVSGGTQRKLASWTLIGVQTNPIIAYPAIRLRYGWDVTLDRISSVDRSFAWRIEN